MPNQRWKDVDAFVNGPLEAARTQALRALWYSAHGDWKSAHEEAQTGHGADCDWVHALLHRDEGDLLNAEYWYRRARRPAYHGLIEVERDAMIATLLRSQI